MALPTSSDLRSRWAMVSAEQRRLSRKASAEQKLTQVSALMQSVEAFGWHDALSDDDIVWQRWSELRRRLCR